MADSPISILMLTKSCTILSYMYMYVEVLVITKYIIRQCIPMAALPILMLTKISPELYGFFFVVYDLLQTD